jgi:hypothetical protein
MSKERTKLYMAGAAIVFAVVAQVGVFAIALSSKTGPAPVAEALNVPPAK